ncbi:MAG: hypothetical protein ACK4NF_01280, partial [Planctomycetota bacterium]
MKDIRKYVRREALNRLENILRKYPLSKFRKIMLRRIKNSTLEEKLYLLYLIKIIDDWTKYKRRLRTNLLVKQCNTVEEWIFEYLMVRQYPYRITRYPEVKSAVSENIMRYLGVIIPRYGKIPFFLEHNPRVASNSFEDFFFYVEDPRLFSFY